MLLAALLLCPSGCLDYGLNPGKMRADCFNRNPGGGSGGNPDAPPEMQLYDTTLYFCAVRFDESYDWQRDTAYGSESFELLLYRDFEPVLSVSSAGSGCVSADFDTHHIIGGHLYTEKSDLSSTVIGRDGVEIIRFEGREFLKGLLPDGEDIYTPRRAGTARASRSARTASLCWYARRGECSAAWSSLPTGRPAPCISTKGFRPSATGPAAEPRGSSSACGEVSNRR